MNLRLRRRRYDSVLLLCLAEHGNDARPEPAPVVAEPAQSPRNVREALAESDRWMVTVTLGSLMLSSVVLNGMVIGFLIRLWRGEGQLNEGVLGALIAGLVMGLMSLPCLRLMRVARTWEQEPDLQAAEEVKDWREALRAPLVVAAVLLLLVVIAIIAESSAGGIPRATALNLLGVLGLGALTNLPATWMSARNAAGSIPKGDLWGVPRWCWWVFGVVTLALGAACAKSTIAPSPNALPETPPTYCYSRQQVEGLVRQGLAQADRGPLQPSGSVPAESYCFTGPLPSPKK